MHVKRVALFLLLCAVVIASVLIASGIARLSLFKYQVGWVGSDGADYMQYRFERFDGEESKVIQVDQSGNLTLHYDISVCTGRLEVKLVSPSGQVVWNKQFMDHSMGIEEIRLEETGYYKLVIHGDSAKGYFNITWST